MHSMFKKKRTNLKKKAIHIWDFFRATSAQNRKEFTIYDFYNGH